MIFAFSGPSCSGKTTLVADVLKILGRSEEVEVVWEVARTVFSEEFSEYKTLDELRMDGEACMKYQLRILTRQIKMEEKAKSRGVIVISDRSIYDCYVYSKLYLSPTHFQKFLKAFEKYAGRRYDTIFLCHPLPPKKDGFRSLSDLQTQQLQLKMMKEVLQTYHPENVIELKRTNHELRIQDVLKRISSIAPMR